MNSQQGCPIGPFGIRVFPPHKTSVCLCSLLFVLLVLLLACASPAFAQNNEWTWVSGPETPQAAVYGTEGMPDAGNFPGNRESAASWTNSKGNLWLFGGNGYDSQQHFGILNDLWKFDPATSEWAWMGGVSTLSQNGVVAQGISGTQGVPDPGNLPQGRSDAVYWTDAQGNFWLFGGYDADSDNNYYNDLWEYNPTTNEWVWVTGEDAEDCTSCTQPGVYGAQGVASKADTPGSRVDAVTWTDNKGNLWLFGGYGYDSSGDLGFLNDLWKFDPSTQEWTWVGGSSSLPSLSVCGDCGVSGVYGIEGTASSSNMPGGRETATGWVDANGNFWLFGGFGVDDSGDRGILNDLWKYDPTTNQWTWMSGSDIRPTTCAAIDSDSCGTPGVYGAFGQPAAANTPGARQESVGWTDKQGNLWLFGGNGVDAAGKVGYLNDLWEYSPSTHQWTWMRGGNTVICPAGFCNMPGTYGTQSVADLANEPPGRGLAASWTDGNGNFWVFGGEGVNAASVWGYFQDLWELQPNNSGQPVAATPTFSPAPGPYTTAQTVSISDTTAGATIQYLINGAGPSTPYAGPIPVSSSETITAIASASGYAGSNLAYGEYSLQITPSATPTFSPGSGSYTGSQTVTISDATPGAVIYYTTDNTVPTAQSNIYSGPVTVSSSETIQAVAMSTGYGASSPAAAVYTIGTSSSGSEWTWIKGQGQTTFGGNYGAQGFPTAFNFPSPREGATSWTDSQGNFWLFGGKGYDALDKNGYLNDLWEYSQSSHEWAWMGGSSLIPCTSTGGVTSCAGSPGVYGVQGTASASNVPGGREGAAHWLDSNGNLWLFGGNGFDSAGAFGLLNDLWEFSASTHEWTWVGGSSNIAHLPTDNNGQPGVYGELGHPSPSNIPGSRQDAATWTDKNGHLWLFGGVGLDAAGQEVTLNDLWEFDPSTNQWTWMGGSDIVSLTTEAEFGAYGTMGVAGESNYPPSRSGAATWTDASGNLWLFGGASSSAFGQLNDLWKYDPTTNEWTWMKGYDGSYCSSDPLVGLSACSSPPPVSGSLGVPAIDNTPGGGSQFASWTDKNGNFWLFGGMASDVTGENNGFYLGQTNALWVYSPTSNEWTWMGGDLHTSNCSALVLIPLPYILCDGPQGNYGTASVASSFNEPGARTQAVTWTDTTGNLWLFSGATINLTDYPTDANDLWEYTPSLNTLPAATEPIFSLRPGIYAVGGPLILSDGIPNATIYYTTDGTTPTTSSTKYTGPITISTSQTVSAFASVPGYSDSSVSSATYTFPSPPAAPTFSPPAGTYNSQQSVTLSDSTPDAAIYYTTDGTTPTNSSFVYRSPILVSSTQTINATAAIAGYFVWDGIAADGGGYAASPNVSATYTINLPIAATPTFSVPAGIYTSAQTVSLSDSTPGATIYYTTDGTTPTIYSPQYLQPITVSSSETIEAIAVASGDANSAVASTQYTVNLPQQDFSMSASPGSLAITAGHSGQATITITPENGFNSVIDFTCSGLPTGASCSFSSTSATSTTLTIETTSESASLHLLSGAFFAGVIGFFFWRKKRLQAFLLLLLIAGGITFTGCGSGSLGGTTATQQKQPVTATITITANSGALQHTATIALTINP